MAIIEKAIRLETTKQNLVQAVIAKQGDSNSRYLKVTFLDEGSVIPLDSSSQVTINAEREDGASQSFFGVVNGDDTATVPLHSWILELDGVVNCDISIIGADSRLTTTTFVVKVEKAACSSGDISTDPQYDVLANLINDVNAAKNGTANAIVGTASGTVVSITDVSPLEHPIGVKLSSDTVTAFSSVTLKKYGKNLLVNTIPTTDFANGTKVVKNQDGSLTVTKKAGDMISLYSDQVYLPSGKYTFSNGLGRDTVQSGLNPVYIVLYQDNGNTLCTLYSYDKASVSLESGYYRFRLYGPEAVAFETFTIYPQIEIGTATEYEPYKEPVICPKPNADGTVDGVTSLYPITTLMTDTEGVTITAEYNVDTKKYIDKKFAELAALIVNS